MKIYLFIINGRPGFRTDWRDAQACLEEHLRDQRDVSDVWWEDEGEDRWYARKYLYGSSHSDISGNPEDDPYLGVNFETTDRLIWEAEVPDPAAEKPLSLDPLLPSVGAIFELTIRSKDGKESATHVVSTPEWEGPHWMRGHALWRFVSETALNIGIRWSQKDGNR